MPARGRVSPRRTAAAVAEVIGAVVLATVAVALLFLVAALVVGRLAAAARERAAEAEARAAQAARREGEAETLAGVAALLLRGSRPDAELDAIADHLGRALGLPVRLERAAILDVASERERVAERAAASEAAQRADVAKTAVLHAISHDLRSPLTAITTAVSGLRTSGISDDDRRELTAAIEGEA